MPKTATLASKATRKVLIIEDEGEMCLLLNIILDDKSLDLDHVPRIANAKEYLQKSRPAVVLLDNKLPDGFGVDFISYIKSNYPGLPVIMISGFDSSVRDVAMENGADAYLEKPFSKDQLYQLIDDLTQQ